MLAAYSVNINPNDQFSYASMEYEYFEVREVLIGGKPKGEWHLKLKDRSSLNSAVRFFRGEIPGADVGAVDPTGFLQMEFPIYVKVDDVLSISSMKSVFDDIDEVLMKFNKSKSKK